MTRSSGRASLSLECLENREVPATLVNGSQFSYQDADGDLVVVTFSKPVLTAANANSVLLFDTGSVNGTNATRQQLRAMNLSVLADAAKGINVTTTATRNHGRIGDGLAALGQIYATGLDLGTINIDGDLGKIRVGDNNTKTAAVKGLVVDSMGRYGLGTGSGSDLDTVVRGKLGLLHVKHDLKHAHIKVQGGLDGDIGMLTIGGSLVGGAKHSSARIIAEGDMGPVRIVGDVIGGSGNSSGRISAQGKGLAGVTIGGSLRGGAGIGSGVIYFAEALGPVTIGASVLGGSGADSGMVTTSNGQLTGAITIGGSVTGGAGAKSGGIWARWGGTATISVAGDVAGGVGWASGVINPGIGAATVTVGGAVRGGSGDISGGIAGGLVSTDVGGDVAGGAGTSSGFVCPGGGAPSAVTIGGSLRVGNGLHSGRINSSYTLGSVVIGGSIIGTPANPANITARGGLSAGTDVAIASLSVGGRVEHALIRAGVEFGSTSVNADAQIGTVTVGGDWIASSLAAGAAAGPNGYFGDADDCKVSGSLVTDARGVRSRIASVTIGGQVLGTMAADDHFGIVAEEVGAVKIGGTALILTVGPGNDDLPASLAGDFRVNEI
jgi:hypothetical protein